MSIWSKIAQRAKGLWNEDPPILLLLFLWMLLMVTIGGVTYNSLRIYAIGETTQTTVDSTIIRLVPGPHGSENYTDVFLHNMHYCMTLNGHHDEIKKGDKLNIIYSDKLRLILIYEGHPLYIEWVYANPIMVVLILLVVIIILFLYIPRMITAFRELNIKLNKLISENNDYIDYRYRFLYYKLYWLTCIVPSIMSILLNVLIVLNISKLIIKTEGPVPFVTGLLLVSLITYLIVISPKMIGWFFDLKFGKQLYLLFIRVAIQLIVGGFFIYKLLSFFVWHSKTYESYPEAFWDMISFFGG